jgi:endonuclease YncB( thermonuclease family)
MGMQGWRALLGLMVGLAACSRGAVPELVEQGATTRGPHEERVVETRLPSDVDSEGLLIGEFRLSERPIVDGDTIRVAGVEGSLRLLSIDTEEKLRSKRARAEVAKNFEVYRERKRSRSSRPPKMGTPMGEQATEFARSFFEGSEIVRLERDDPKKLRGSYGRLLAYAFVRKDGKWVSYNVECVRAGMSPYFTKYGYSHRFHNQLSRAEAEAKEAQRGIWNPDAQGYGDYGKRKAWWNARADFIRAFEHEANGRDDYVDLTRWDAEDVLESRLGDEVTLLSTVDRIQRFKKLTRATLAMKQGRGFPLIFFDRKPFLESNVAAFTKEPIRVRGTLSRYEKGEYRTLQIVVTSASQITVPDLPPTD